MSTKPQKMDPSTQTTDEMNSGAEEMSAGASTADELDPFGARTAQFASTHTRVASLSISREQCSGCGATLASDQRYCVECGQRCGPSRLPFTEGLVERVQPTPRSRVVSRRPRLSVNNTLIAGIGTLLLAMGIGVLIGRSGTSSSIKSASPAVQVVTVPGAGGVGGAATGPTEAQTSTSSTATTRSKGAVKSASRASKKAAVPPAKTVHVGSSGSGPGYQKGHFTGNFFGG